MPRALEPVRDLPGLLGLAPVRGGIVPVLDGGVLLGLRAANAEDTGECRLVVLQVDGQRVALAVQDVLGVRVLAPEALETLRLPGGDANEWKTGRLEEGFARLLDAGGLIPQSVWDAVQASSALHAQPRQAEAQA